MYFKNQRFKKKHIPYVSPMNKTGEIIRNLIKSTEEKSFIEQEQDSIILIGIYKKEGKVIASYYSDNKLHFEQIKICRIITLAPLIANFSLPHEWSE